jgi:hypothetical protein
MACEIVAWLRPRDNVRREPVHADATELASAQ